MLLDFRESWKTLAYRVVLFTLSDRLANIPRVGWQNPARKTICYSFNTTVISCIHRYNLVVPRNFEILLLVLVSLYFRDADFFGQSGLHLCPNNFFDATRPLTQGFTYWMLIKLIKICVKVKDSLSWMESYEVQVFTSIKETACRLGKIIDSGHIIFQFIVSLTLF